MKRIFCVLLVFPFLLPLTSTAADPAPASKAAAPGTPPAAEAEDQESGPSVWMKKKLDYSQHILAGITQEDFDKIADNARAMKGLGKVEAFVRSRNAAYTRQLQTFEDINDEIIRQADKDNVEGVALAFTQLTINCVNCHKVLRLHDRSSSGK